MKITDIKHYCCPIPSLGKFTEDHPLMPCNFMFTKIETDEGITGESCIWTGAPFGPLGRLLDTYKGFMIGKDPLMREQFWQFGDQLLASTFDYRGISAIDIALWDIAGKKTGLPIYKLLGGYRDKMRTYASTIGYPTDEAYVEECMRCVEEGYTAIKLHSYGKVEKDIRLCTAVRAAVGDDIDLMIDPLNCYDRFDALKLGYVLRDLNFYWYEAPIMDYDVDGYAWLHQNLPGLRIVANESNCYGFREFSKFVEAKACDILRGVGDSTGGITAMRKAAGFCEGHCLGYEPHSYGPTLVQAAHLHVMLSMKNCDFFEAPVPTGICDKFMIDTIKVQKDGYVYPSDKPGLGYQVDWESVEAADKGPKIGLVF